MKSASIAFGIVFLAVGLGTGYLICAFPKGLNPSWPLGAALLAPAAFTLGGFHLVAQGLGYSELSAAALKAIGICFLGIANWAAFFTARVPCRQTVSFFGVPLLARYPSDAECRAGLRTIVVSVDAAVAIVLIALAWRKLRNRPGESAQ